MDERFAGRVLRSPADGGERPPTMGEIGLAQFAPYLMNRIAARWNANMAEELKAYDMTTLKMRTLAILSISSALTINELAVYAVTEQSTMSRTLDGLEDQGLIRRQTRPDDLRVRDITITQEGRAAFEKVWPMMYARFSQMFDGVDEEEYRTFTATLHKLLRNIRRHEL